MRIRIGLFVGILAATLIAASLYIVNRTTRTAPLSPAPVSRVEPTAPQALEPEAGKLYCAERAGGNGVMVSTGPDCASDAHGDGPMAPSITITREDGALVITGADP